MSAAPPAPEDGSTDAPPAAGGDPARPRGGAESGSPRELGAPRDVQWREPGVGVPEGVVSALRMLAQRLGAESLDRLWIFPPRVRGRKESGLVAVSRFHPEAEGRRLLFTAPYTAERTGQGPVVESSLSEEGEAPPDRLGRIMDGVVRRSGEELGEPREIEIGGDARRLENLIEELVGS